MRPYLPLTLLLLVPAFPVAGQQLAESRFERAEIRPVAAVAPIPAQNATSPATAADADADAGGGLLSTRSVIHALGGAIVGSWIGLFGAQVVHSDWDETRDGDFGPRRTQWAAAGAVVGLLGSRLVTRTTTPLPGPPAVRSSRNRDVMLRDEIDEARATVNNAYQLIENRRKNWLIPRGTNSWRETTGGVAETEGRNFVINIEEGHDKIIVYMDDIKIGGPEDMRDIPLDGIVKAEFIDARRATYLYGAGHSHGVIRLSTEVRAPSGS